MPENQEQLLSIPACHMVEGETMAAPLTEVLSTGGGQATLTTINGATLTATTDDAEKVVLTVPAGGIATITQTDIDAPSGLMQIDGRRLHAVLLGRASRDRTSRRAGRLASSAAFA